VNTGSPGFAINFGQDGNSHLFRKEGWSEPEPRYTWTTGLASSLELPRPDEQGEYLLELNVHPFISDGKISTQKLRVMVNDSEVADFEIRVTSSLECLVPWTLLKSHAAISVKFAHPLAASRRAVTGEPDERLIALAFQRISLRKLHDAANISTLGSLLDDRDSDDAKVTEPGEKPTAPITLEGHVDAYAYHPPSASWWFVGWASQSWPDDRLTALTAHFHDRDESGETLAGFYHRPGLQGRGQGLVVALRSKPRKRQINQSCLLSLKVETTDFAFDIDGHATEPLGTDRLLDLLGPIFAEAGPIPTSPNCLGACRRMPRRLICQPTRLTGIWTCTRMIQQSGVGFIRAGSLGPGPTPIPRCRRSFGTAI
jgi:hypothetical protein